MKPSTSHLLLTTKNGQPTGYSFTYSSNQNSYLYGGTGHVYGRYNSNIIIPSGYGTVEEF